MALNVKKGDTVLVIAGKDKGKTGKVLNAMPADNSVVVAGVNIVSKHKKPRSAQDKGGIIKRENKIDASNVQIICQSCGKATRVKHNINNGEKIRVCNKCGANLDISIKKTTKDTTKSTTKNVENKQANQTKTDKADKKVESAVKKETKSTSKTSKSSSTSAKSAGTKKTTKSTTKKVESK